MSNHTIKSILPMKDIITVLLSGASFLLSCYTLWVVQFNRGKLKMTQPTLLCLKRDLPSGVPKIFLRTLLFTTGTKGRIIQAMFLKVRNSGGTHLLDYWGHTEGGKLTLGSGLFIGPTGVACDHHFNPHRGSDFHYVKGQYHIEIFAVMVDQPKPTKLMELAFVMEGPNTDDFMRFKDMALFLEWNADTRDYDQNVERHAP